MHKAQKSPAVQKVGVSAFYKVVSFVCEDTLRHPPTRQYLSSCVEVLGQVCICSNKYMHILQSSSVFIYCCVEYISIKNGYLSQLEY